MELRSGTITAGGAAQPPRCLSQESLAMFQQGVGLVLGRWTVLQLAIHNQWGGPSSQQKAQQLHTDIVAWMTQSKEPRYIDELEDMLDENLVLLFNTEAEDGSLQEVAEHIMSIHEECLEDNYESVRGLLTSTSVASHSASMSQQLPCEADEDESLEGPTSLSGSKDTDDMDVDNTQPGSGLTATTNNNRGKVENLTMEEEADGWQVVSRNRRKPHRT